METKPSKNKQKKIIILSILGVFLAILIVIFLIRGFLKPKEYTVTFDTDGGTIIDSIVVKEHETITKPTDPVKEDYVFMGWYLNNQLFDFNIKIIQDITLKAKWSKEDESIVLKDNQLNLLVNETKKIEIETLPKDLTIDDLIFTSSDETILTVDNNGNILALKEGQATIKIQSKDGSYTAECLVTITTQKIELTSISISGQSQVTVGNQINLTVNFTPLNATDKTITWESNNPSIATVDKNGHVKGLKAGNVVIIAKSNNGLTASKNIKVVANSTPQNNSGASNNQNNNNNSNNSNNNNNNNSQTPAPPPDPQTPQEPPAPQTIPVSSISINGDSSVYVGNTIKLTATINPNNATDKTITWESNNPSIATVDKDGNVKGLKAGSVTITAKSNNGKTATKTINVIAKEPVYVITLTAQKQEVTNAIFQYRYTITKDNQTFNDYLGFTLNGKPVPKNTSTVAKDIVDINSKNPTAILTLSDGTTKNAKVVIK